jgi:hypothetical protein
MKNLSVPNATQLATQGQLECSKKRSETQKIHQKIQTLTDDPFEVHNVYIWNNDEHVAALATCTCDRM